MDKQERLDAATLVVTDNVLEEAAAGLTLDEGVKAYLVERQAEILADRFMATDEFREAALREAKKRKRRRVLSQLSQRRNRRR